MQAKHAVVAGVVAGTAALAYGAYTNLAQQDLPDDAVALSYAQSEISEAEAEISDLRAELEAGRAALEAQTQEAEALRSELAALQANADGHSDALSDHEAQIAERDTRIADLEGQLSEAEARIAALEGELEAARAAPAPVPDLVALDVDADKPLVAEGEAVEGLAAVEASKDAGTEDAESVSTAAVTSEAAPGTAEPALATASATGSAADSPLAEVHFEMGSARLTPGGAVRALDAAARIAQMDLAKIRLTGHSDTTGDPEMNRRLSQARAEAVREVLIEQGIPDEMIEAVGVGETAEMLPIPTGPGVSEPLNRRVGIYPQLRQG